MARQLRIECENGLYHVTARGNARSVIFVDKNDNDKFIECLASVVDRYQWFCHGYCLMSNHYHLLIETPLGNLSQGMKILNGRYAQYFNHRYKKVGHVFQGRFKGILVEKESYLLELSRYLVLNPVRAEMVRHASEWPWSSYRAMAGMVTTPTWLTVDWLLGAFGCRVGKARLAYKQFVSEGGNQPSPFNELKNQIYLGSAMFVEEMQCQLDPGQSLEDIPRPQIGKVKKPLTYYAEKMLSRNQKIALAYRSGCYTQYEIGSYFGVSHATVSRAVKSYESSR